MKEFNTLKYWNLFFHPRQQKTVEKVPTTCVAVVVVHLWNFINYLSMGGWFWVKLYKNRHKPTHIHKKSTHTSRISLFVWRTQQINRLSITMPKMEFYVLLFSSIFFVLFFVIYSVNSFRTERKKRGSQTRMYFISKLHRFSLNNSLCKISMVWLGVLNLFLFVCLCVHSF